jgi:hypothetical protein
MWGLGAPKYTHFSSTTKNLSPCLDPMDLLPYRIHTYSAIARCMGTQSPRMSGSCRAP